VCNSGNILQVVAKNFVFGDYSKGLFFFRDGRTSTKAMKKPICIVGVAARVVRLSWPVASVLKIIFPGI